MCVHQGAEISAATGVLPITCALERPPGLKTTTANKTREQRKLTPWENLESQPLEDTQSTANIRKPLQK